MQTRRRRVPALAPQERRAALVAATLPLLRTHGTAVTTRQIAEAAGVAEGTIFGVFPDKSSLIVAALASAFDEHPIVRALQAIDPGGSLRERLGDAVAILMRRFEANAQLMMVARTLPPDTAQPLMEHLMESRKRLTEALAAVVEPDRDQLRRSPRTVARLLFVVVMTTAHMEATEPEALAPGDIVGVLLDGLLIRPTGDA